MNSMAFLRLVQSSNTNNSFFINIAIFGTLSLIGGIIYSKKCSCNKYLPRFYNKCPYCSKLKQDNEFIVDITITTLLLIVACALLFVWLFYFSQLR